MKTDAIERILVKASFQTYINAFDVLDAKAELAAIKESLRWRDVREELPGVGEFDEIECHNGEDPFYMLLENLDSIEGITNKLEANDATHWRPLLPGPDGEEAGES